jgi:hypothetical protein
VKRQLLTGMTTICVALIGAGGFSVAQAQFGFGVGGWGDHFGTWFGVWPDYRPYRSYTPPQSTGHLEGTVTLHSLCPADLPKATCPSAPNALFNITIIAEPEGETQWVTTMPDARGDYKLSLPPGAYNVRLQHPAQNITGATAYRVIIQPGKTSKRDFDISLPVQ